VKRNHLERDSKLYLQEILDFIERIETYTKGMTYEEFAKDQKTMDAVNVNLRNVGEAVRVLSKHRRFKELMCRHRIPYIDLADIRTDMTHEYFAVNAKSIWQTTHTLIGLQAQFRKVLEEVAKLKN
jgi:uncharacterized protein with HEPN domain